MGDSDDDLFASLGGALMKNLLADLNDDGETGGLLSLEELEKELSHLDDGAAQQPTFAEPQQPATAASMVLMAQQQDQRANSAAAPAPLTQPVDAWALSLEKFTAASLQDDFLQADSARKAQTVPPPPAPVQTQTPQPFLSKMEDYDVSEPLAISAPPGLSSAGNDVTQTLVQQLTSKLETVVVSDGAVTTKKPIPPPQRAAAPPVPKPRAMPKTPQNSVTTGVSTPPMVPQQQQPAAMKQGQVKIQKPPPTPPNTLQSQPREVVQQQPGPPAAPQLPPPAAGMPPNAWNKPPPGPMIPPPMQGPPMGMYGPPPQMPVPMPGHMPPPGPMGAPQQRPVVFCDPRPNAQPIPASTLASDFMSARDITYVVHSILKPLLNYQQQNPSSPFDYDKAYWQRAGGGAPPTNTYSRRQGVKSGKKYEKEMVSREKKAQSWSEEHSTLGRTAKSNVTRPRALIAQPIKSDADSGSNKENSEQRQRQALWKARIYCDQAYQAYLNVVGTWHSATSPGQNMSPQAAARLQPHLFKLLKCLGVSKVENEEDEDSDQPQAYNVANESALPLLVKLPKGRVLLARVLEQALLPPAAVNALLPALFKAVFALALPPPPQINNAGDADAAAASANAHMVDERLFASMTRVLHTLPDLSGTDIQKCLDAAQENPSVSLNSKARMAAVHAVLQRGAQLASSDVTFAPTWKTREDEFMKILSG